MKNMLSSASVRRFKINVVASCFMIFRFLNEKLFCYRPVTLKTGILTCLMAYLFFERKIFPSVNFTPLHSVYFTPRDSAR